MLHYKQALIVRIVCYDEMKESEMKVVQLYSRRRRRTKGQVHMITSIEANTKMEQSEHQWMRDREVIHITRREI